MSENVNVAAVVVALVVVSLAFSAVATASLLLDRFRGRPAPRVVVPPSREAGEEIARHLREYQRHGGRL